MFEQFPSSYLYSVIFLCLYFLQFYEVDGLTCPHGYKSETANTETDLGQQPCSALNDEKLVKHECYMLNCSDGHQTHKEWGCASTFNSNFEEIGKKCVLKSSAAGQKPNFFEMDGLQGFKCSCIFATELGVDTVTTPPSPTTIHPETSSTTDLLPNTSSEDPSLAVPSHRVGNLVMFLAILLMMVINFNI
ncbi:hypothetical protein niasHS_008818 [Heterodera schachtii]|uniref:Uncharacterized protein n=1 Tax=Heterodera schachtii TaxID=97005 RepID=A0ABD2IXA5_HETSC